MHGLDGAMGKPSRLYQLWGCVLTVAFVAAADAEVWRAIVTAKLRRCAGCGR